MAFGNMLRRGTATGGMVLMAVAGIPLSGCDSRATLTPDEVIEGLQFYPETPDTNSRALLRKSAVRRFLASLRLWPTS